MLIWQRICMKVYIQVLQVWVRETENVMVTVDVNLGSTFTYLGMGEVIIEI